MFVIDRPAPQINAAGVNVESSPVRREEEEAAPATPEESEKAEAARRGVLDKRPSYAERFSCLIGLEGSRGKCMAGVFVCVYMRLSLGPGLGYYNQSID